MNKGQAEILVEYCNGILGKYYESYLIETIFIAPASEEKFIEILQNIKEGKLDLNLQILQNSTSFEVLLTAT